MADFFSYSTESLLLQWTEELSISDNHLPKIRRKNRLEPFLYHPIDPVNEIIISSVIFCVGLVLNALILRCYWGVKTSTAVYIRVLAVYDIVFLFCVITIKLLIVSFPAHAEEIGIAQLFLTILFATNGVLGPLFMALDRYLIVAFPHTYQKHEKKMRIVKILIAVLQNMASVLYCAVSAAFGPSSEPAILVLALSTPLFFMQFLACVVLYVVIVWKVRASTRKVQPVPQAGIP